MGPATKNKDAMEDIKVLLRKLKDRDWWVRKEIIEKLLEHPEALYISELEKGISNGDDALLRNASIEAYRALGRRAFNSLVSMLKEEDPDVRVFSANILGDIKETKALSALIDALDDPDDNVRAASAEALGKIGDDRAIYALAESLDDAAEWVVMASIDAIGLIGGKDALTVLHACLEKEDYRGMVCDAIGRAGDQSSISHLSPLLDLEDTKELALQAIVSIAEKEQFVPPLSLFSSRIDQLIGWLGSPRDEIRSAAFIALSWSEDIRGVPHFLKAFEDDALLEYGINGLLAVGKKALPEIIKAMKGPIKNKVALAKVLSMMGEAESLMLFVKDEDDEVRTEVALAIGSLRTPESREALQALSIDSCEEVREAALLSLNNFER